MNNREEFAELLYNTFFDDKVSPDEVKKKLTPLRDWIKNNIPERLYRYRTINEYSISALEKDEIWGSTIHTFNDPFECLPCYNIKTIDNDIKADLSGDSFIKKMQMVRNNEIPPEVAKYLTPEQISSFSIYAQQMSDNPAIFNMIYKQLINTWNENMDMLESNFIIDIVRHEGFYNIACFSETNSSTLMWAHYSDSNKGFCIEYDIKSFLVDCACNCSNIHMCSGFMLNLPIAPVIYRDERYDATDGFRSKLVNWMIQTMNIPLVPHYYDMFIPTKTMLTKHKSWEYEQEWRLFRLPFRMEELSDHRKIAHLSATAIYLGTKITNENKEKLLKICKDKNIPCYQMLPQYFSPKYESAPHQLL